MNSYSLVVVLLFFFFNFICASCFFHFSGRVVALWTIRRLFLFLFCACVLNGVFRLVPPLPKECRHLELKNAYMHVNLISSSQYAINTVTVEFATRNVLLLVLVHCHHMHTTFMVIFRWINMNYMTRSAPRKSRRNESKSKGEND